MAVPIPDSFEGGLSREDHGQPPEALPRVPDHLLIRRIGKGAYGEVWLARSILGAHRAIKIVRRTSFRDERTYEREFHGIEQYEPVSRTHDGLLDVLQAGRNDDAGYYYYVMELADDAGSDPGNIMEDAAPSLSMASGPASPPPGSVDPDRYLPRNLATLLQRRGRLPPSECVEIGLNLTLALSHLHRHGLIHRDIKPANIIFTRGIPKLADIGLVTRFDDTCSFVGTEGFIAPEGPTSPRADLYSLGKVLYEISTGKDRKDFPEPPTGFGEDADTREYVELNAVILKACAVDPADRYPSAADFHADLALLNSGRSVTRKRIVERRLAFARRAGAVVGFLAVLTTGAYLVQRHQTREAVRLRGVAETLATGMQIRYAETLFGQGDSGLALAHLAQVLRREPGNRGVAERLLSALSQRTFPRQVMRPLRLATPPVLRHLQVPAHLSPDGRTILTAEDDHTVRLWDVEKGAEATPPVPHPAVVTDAIFNVDGSRIATAGEDGGVRILDAHTGLPLMTRLERGPAVVKLAFDASDTFLAAACLDSSARLYHAKTGHLERTLVHDAPVQAVVFGPTGSWLATATANGGVWIWEAATGRLRHRIAATGTAMFLAASPNGKWLAGVNRTEGEESPWMVQVWDAESGEPVGAPRCRGNRIYALTFSPDSQRYVAATADNAARVLNVASGEEHLLLRHSSLVYTAVYSPDGRRILTGSVDRKARLWDAETGDPVTEPMVHAGRVIHAEFSRDARRVLTVGWQDQTVKLWDVTSRASAAVVLPHESWVLGGEFDATGENILTWTGRRVDTADENNRWAEAGANQVVVWGAAKGESKLALSVPAEAKPIVAQFTRSGPFALTGKADSPDQNSGEVEVWDLAKANPTHLKIQTAGVPICARFDGDGRQLVTGCADGTIELWEVRTGRRLAPPLHHLKRVRTVRFGPDGSTLLSTSDDGTAVIWETSSGRVVAGPLPHDAKVWFGEFSPAGDKVVTTSLDFAARVWSIHGNLIATLRHAAAVEYAEFSPDGDRVVTASADFTARLWSAATGRQLTEEPLQHSQLVVSARFSPDGLRVITTSFDGTAILWDSVTGLRLADPFRHGHWVTAAAFSPDGSRVLTGSLDGMARVWDVAMLSPRVPSWLPEFAEVVAGRRLGHGRDEESVPWDARPPWKEKTGKEVDDPFPADWVRRYTGDSSGAEAGK